LTRISAAFRLVAFPKNVIQDSRLRIYRPTRELLAQIEHLLAANKPSFHHSPLDDVIEVLCQGRRYSWVGIYLTVEEKKQQLLVAGGENGLNTIALPQTRSKILVTMKLAGRELGVLAAESDRENAFGSEDRVLLENAAGALARFLAGRGKYLVRKARSALLAQTTVPTHSPHSTSEVKRSVSAAVGEK